MQAVAEGYPTARSAWQLARKHAVVTPVIDNTCAMLYEGEDISRMVAGKHHTAEPCSRMGGRSSFRFSAKALPTSIPEGSFFLHEC